MILALLFSLSLTLSFANDDHDHDHGHDQSEENSAVGPEKGIIEKSSLGFKLSPEAVQTFELKMIEVKSKTLEIPSSALVLIKDTKTVFRIRDQWILRVPVRIISKNSASLQVETLDYNSKDQIVIQGTGFLRASEVITEEAVSHGHSH